LVSKDWETNLMTIAQLGVSEWMVDFGCPINFRRLESIVSRELYFKEENATLIWGPFWPKYCH
jgi:hypothetical protein